MHPLLQNAHLQPAARAVSRPSKFAQTIVGSHQPVGLRMLRLAIRPPIVSERPLAGPVGQPSPGYHRFFRSASRQGQWLRRDALEAKVSMFHEAVRPAACKPASLDRASGSQTGLSAALCRAAMAGGSSASGLAVPLHSYTTRILSAQMRQFQRQINRQTELDRKSAIHGLTINESTGSGNAR